MPIAPRSCTREDRRLRKRVRHAREAFTKVQIERAAAARNELGGQTARRTHGDLLPEDGADREFESRPGSLRPGRCAIRGARSRSVARCRLMVRGSAARLNMPRTRLMMAGRASRREQ